MDPSKAAQNRGELLGWWLSRVSVGSSRSFLATRVAVSGFLLGLVWVEYLLGMLELMLRYFFHAHCSHLPIFLQPLQKLHVVFVEAGNRRLLLILTLIRQLGELGINQWVDVLQRSIWLRISQNLCRIASHPAGRKAGQFLWLVALSRTWNVVEIRSCLGCDAFEQAWRITMKLWVPSKYVPKQVLALDLEQLGFLRRNLGHWFCLILVFIQLFTLQLSHLTL